MKREIFKSDLLKEEYVKVTCESGLELYICAKKQLSSAYAVFGAKYGSIDTSYIKQDGTKCDLPEGVAHFLEHKLFESEQLDAFEQFAKTGAYSNAYTSFDKTCYLFSCSDLFDENLDILLGFVTNPYFTEQTVLKEQGIIGQEIDMYKDSAGWCVMFNMLKAMYSSHPVRIDIAGTKESIAQISSDTLYDCYNTFYNPSNMFLCIAGNVDAEKIISAVNAKIKSKPKILKELVTKDEPSSPNENYIEQFSQVAMPVFCYGFKESGEKLSIRDKICSSVLLDVIASDISPLFETLTEQGLINDEFSSEHFCGRGYAVSMFEGESRDPKAVVQSINEEILRLKEQGIDEDLVTSVINGMYGSIIRRFNSAESIATLLVDAAVDNEPLFEELEVLKTITKADVEQKLSNLKLENAVLSVIYPKEKKDV
ncbi:MAG: insulinase family protein [Clostridia bacterium]|nr:insulinase family protein [Clostridia bacterium]